MFTESSVLKAPLVFSLSMMTFGQCVLCVSMLISNLREHASNIILTVFFSISGMLAITPVVEMILPNHLVTYFSLSLLGWLMLAPSLWLYVQAMTSTEPWKLSLKMAYHFSPAVLGILVSVLILNLSEQEAHDIFIAGKDINEGYLLTVVVALFITVLFWIVQTTYYSVKIVRQLLHYQALLKSLFANNENRELLWVYWVLCAVVLSWLSLLTLILIDMSGTGIKNGVLLGVVFSLVMVWTLAYWGLRQKPGFEGRYLIAESQAEAEISQDKHGTGESASPAKKKYARSALGAEQSERIAKKIKIAMEEDQLHLDPNISLHILAKHVAISPNYISQTLNETMETTFFDFINKWRIETAKPMIIANEDSVLNIAYAVGFNARSSFYKVFKRETGQTPTEYRKSNGS
ncbi:helix-turn-helix domain-containing protein [Agaribacter flavus]|uniref:Helix-turn-helix domain-containing protein n=1 Tax=Agaribacter flavus TaxID=1902781 RepID=A0ABV7FXK2_9ALTE